MADGKLNIHIYKRVTSICIITLVYKDKPANILFQRLLTIPFLLYYVLLQSVANRSSSTMLGPF
jgi:hypothetical protein